MPSLTFSQLSPAQITALRTLVANEASLAAARQNGDDGAIANWLNLDAAPDFWVFRTLVTKHEYTRTTSVDSTTFNWPALIARSAGEQFGWKEIFNSVDATDPSLPNVRQGFQDIFSGSANNAPAQRAHLLAISRRKASNAEKALATGTGSTSTPATMSYEGDITPEQASLLR